MKKASVRHGLLRRLFFQSIFYVEGNWFCPISILEFVTRFAIFLVFSEQNNSLLFSSPWSKTLKPRIIATKQMGVFLMKMKKQRPNKWRTFAKRRLKQALLHCVWHYYFSNVDGFTNQCFFMFLTAAMRLKGRVDGVHCSLQRWVQSGHKSGHTSAFQISHSSVLAKGVQ